MRDNEDVTGLIILNLFLYETIPDSRSSSDIIGRLKTAIENEIGKLEKKEIKLVSFERDGVDFEIGWELRSEGMEHFGPLLDSYETLVIDTTRKFLATKLIQKLVWYDDEFEELKKVLEAEGLTRDSSLIPDSVLPSWLLLAFGDTSIWWFSDGVIKCLDPKGNVQYEIGAFSSRAEQLLSQVRKGQKLVATPPTIQGSSEEMVLEIIEENPVLLWIHQNLETPPQNLGELKIYVEKQQFIADFLGDAQLSAFIYHDTILIEMMEEISDVPHTFMILCRKKDEVPYEILEYARLRTRLVRAFSTYSFHPRLIQLQTEVNRVRDELPQRPGITRIGQLQQKLIEAESRLSKMQSAFDIKRMSLSNLLSQLQTLVDPLPENCLESPRGLVKLYETSRSPKRRLTSIVESSIQKYNEWSHILQLLATSVRNLKADLREANQRNIAFFGELASLIMIPILLVISLRITNDLILSLIVSILGSIIVSAIASIPRLFAR